MPSRTETLKQPEDRPTWGRAPRLGRRQHLAELIRMGGLEAVLALFLAAFTIVAHLAVSGPWPALVLDLLACLAAAASGRWPRTGAAALAVVLAVFLTVPPAWQTLGEYAAMIPVLGAGMRGEARPRIVMTAVYLPLVAAISWMDAPTPASAILGWTFWVVAFAVMWAIGSGVARTIEAQRRARLADLLQQRQALARELHDTVAASLTKLVLVSERIRLRGTASEEELDLLAQTAAASVHDLRWIVSLLRDPADREELNLLRPTSLGVALKSAEDQLSRHGFDTSVTIRGDAGRLSREQSEVLSAITTEATTNIIKHGDASRSTFIIVEVADEEAELVFVNSTRGATPSVTHEDALGLVGMRERIADLDGQITLEQHHDRWVTRVGIPLVVDHRPPSRAA